MPDGKAGKATSMKNQIRILYSEKYVELESARPYNWITNSDISCEPEMKNLQETGMAENQETCLCLGFCCVLFVGTYDI